MYDLVTKEFFGNANPTGDDFTPGPEVSSSSRSSSSSGSSNSSSGKISIQAFLIL